MGTYNQLNGRPHSGLSNPAKYGLSYEEVVNLVVRGEWKNFLMKYRRKEQKLARVEAHGFLCPSCNTIVEDLDLWMNDGKKCKGCDSRRAGVTRRRTGEYKNKKKLPKKSKIRSCYFCGLRKVPEKKLVGKDICRHCLRKYRKLTDAIQYTRGAKRVRNKDRTD